MAHAAFAGAEVALPEPPHPEGAAADPAGGALPHIVTPCNAKTRTAVSKIRSIRTTPISEIVLVLLKLASS